MVWPFVLIYVVVVGRIIWVRANQDNINRLLFGAVAFSFPEICLTILVFSWGLMLASGCEFYLSSASRGQTCLWESWDITDWTVAGPVAQLAMLFVLPIWALFFGIVYVVAKIWDRIEGRGDKN